MCAVSRNNGKQKRQDCQQWAWSHKHLSQHQPGAAPFAYTWPCRVPSVWRRVLRLSSQFSWFVGPRCGVKEWQCRSRKHRAKHHASQTNTKKQMTYTRRDCQSNWDILWEGCLQINLGDWMRLKQLDQQMHTSSCKWLEAQVTNTAFTTFNTANPRTQRYSKKKTENHSWLRAAVQTTVYLYKYLKYDIAYNPWQFMVLCRLCQCQIAPGIADVLHNNATRWSPIRKPEDSFGSQTELNDAFVVQKCAE